MRRTLVFAVLILGSATAITAQTNSTTRLVPYSGTAQDHAGVPLSGQVEVTFQLFEEQEGGAPLWRETQRVLTDDRGRYLAYLGAVTPMPQIAFTEERARWLGVTIAGRALPRAMLVAVPYALRAADADTLGGQPADSFVRNRPDGRLETSAGIVVAEEAVEGTGVTGQLAKWASPAFLSSSVISESATNRVGVGLPDPTGGGVVDSVFTIRNFDNNTGFAVLNETQQRRFALNTVANGGWIAYDGGGGSWHAGLAQLDGRALLGTTTPETGSSFVGGRLTVRPGTGEDGIFIRKPTSDTFNGAIHARSDAGITGVLIKAIAGVADNVDSGGNYAIFGRNEIASGVGVRGRADSLTGIGVHGSGGMLAGQFDGNVTVTGTLSKGGGSFTIDHPLDPVNKYLQHSFVESPDMMNVYNGNATLDASGEAWVILPEWFEALNRDFRYQLTAIGAPGPNLHVASKIAANRFRIAGGTAGGEVSWQVTGIRQDAWANAHRIVVEKDKPEAKRGSYLHPQEHSQPETAGAASNK